MRIGILTHCVANNFGANLQALSTAFYLKNHGFEPIFIKWDYYLEERNKLMDKNQLYIHQHFLKEKGFIVTHSCKNNDDIINIIKDYDIQNIIIGSDAIFTIDSWIEKIKLNKKGIRYNSPKDKIFPNPFWVPFYDEIKSDFRYFYLSPSCQSSLYKYWSSSKKKKMKEYLSHASYISSRDTYTSLMLQHLLHSNTEIPLTPDPVWGFNSNIMELPSKDAILQKFCLKEDYILVSFYKGLEPSTAWFNSLANEAHKYNMTCYSLPMPQGNFNSPLQQNISLPLNPIDWYCLIKYAKGYIGNNMHPIIVSIHNQTPFFSIDQHGRKFISKIIPNDTSSKVYDLLKRFNLLEYRIAKNKLNEITTKEICEKIANFNIEQLESINKIMHSQYLDLMNNICLNFIKK